METSLRSCGRTHCPPQQRPPECHLHLARLDAVPSTLLIPLAARAHGHKLYPWLDCGDTQAAYLLSCLHTPVEPMLEDRMAVLNVLWRTRVLKEWGQAFFQAHPQGTGIALGCGLSHHFQWLDQGQNHWVDADLAEVQALRAQLLPVAGGRRQSRTTDLLKPGWWQRLMPQPTTQPCWVLCEGVLMYFTPQQVYQVLREFAESAPPGSHFVLDAISHVGVGQARHSLSVSRTGAEFRWGLHDTRELLDCHPRLRLVTTRSASECYGWWGWATEAACMPWTGAPLYSMVALEV